MPETDSSNLPIKRGWLQRTPDEHGSYALQVSFYFGSNGLMRHTLREPVKDYLRNALPIESPEHPFSRAAFLRYSVPKPDTRGVIHVETGLIGPVEELTFLFGKKRTTFSAQ